LSFDCEGKILQRFYSFVELKSILVKIGFNILGVYSNFMGLPYSTDSPRIVIIAQKGVING